MLKKAVLHLSILFTFVKGTGLFFETLSVGSVPGIDHSMYITLETSYVFILYIYYLRIKLTGFCQHRHVYTGTVYISCLFGCKPKKGVGIQNCRYSRIAGR